MPGGRLCPACRKSVLSRYNKQPLCGPCTRAAKMAPQQENGYAAPAWLWDSAPWRDALARTDLPVALAVFRGASGLSQHQLADITGWSQGTLSFFETGQRETLYDIRALLRFADAVDMPREALLPLVLGRADAALPDDWLTDLTLADAGVQEVTIMDVDRRSFGGIAAGAAAAVALPEITVPSRVTPAHVSYLQTCVERIRSRDQNLGGGAVLRQASTQFRRARCMLDKSDYSDPIGRALLIVTADLAVAARLGRVRLRPTAVCEAALQRGRATCRQRRRQRTNRPRVSEHGLAVHVSGARQRSTRRRSRGPETRRSRRPCCSERGIAAAACARSASAGGCPRQARRRTGLRSAITQAHREFDRGPHPADPSWARFITSAEITGHEAMGWVSLGSPGRAAALYRVVLDDESLLPRNRLYYHARLTGALLAEGDNAQAIAEGLAVLPSLGDGHVTSQRTFNELRPLRPIGERLGADEFCTRFDAIEQTLAA